MQYQIHKLHNHIRHLMHISKSSLLIYNRYLNMHNYHILYSPLLVYSNLPLLHIM